jgi:hypothetical protein
MMLRMVLPVEMICVPLLLKLKSPEPPEVSVIVPPFKWTSPSTFIVPTPLPLAIFKVPLFKIKSPPTLIVLDVLVLTILKSSLMVQFPAISTVVWDIEIAPEPALANSKSPLMTSPDEGKKMAEVIPVQLIERL